MLPGEPELRNIADRILGMSSADQTEVLLFGTDSALTRFANSYIHQNVEQTSVEVAVRAVIGKKIGVAGTNILSDDSLRAVVERATTLARHQKENDGVPLPAVAGARPAARRLCRADSRLRPRRARERRRPGLRRRPQGRREGRRRFPHLGRRGRRVQLAGRLRLPPRDERRHQHDRHVRHQQRLRRSPRHRCRRD